MPIHDKRVALVTGGNRGIGYAIGRSLAQRGITVILGVRDPNKGATACSHLQSEDLDVNFELLDVTDEGSIQTALKHIQVQFGRLDILVNNAGIIDSKTALEVSEAEWDRVIDVNLKSAHLCSQAVTRERVERLQVALRHRDILLRYGDEAFVLLTDAESGARARPHAEQN